MKLKPILLSFLLSSTLLSFFPLQAVRPKAQMFKSPEAAQNYLFCHYNCGLKFFDFQDWPKAAKEFEKVIFFCPDSESAANAYYLLGISYFQMGEYDFANQAFSNYLSTSEHPQFFEETIFYKLQIAEAFKCGAKKRLFRYCPKILSTKSTALNVYDEIVIAVPNHPLAAKALYSKGCLLQSMQDYSGSIDSFQTLLRRFPKYEFAPDVYLRIAETYYMQSHEESQNPDLLALADLNIRRFEMEYPRDERLSEARQYALRMKEIYAQSLCDLGKFYERTSHPPAAALYYRSAIEQFPATQTAQFCWSRLKVLGFDYCETCPEAIYTEQMKANFIEDTEKECNEIEETNLSEIDNTLDKAES